MIKIKKPLKENNLNSDDNNKLSLITTISKKYFHLFKKADNFDEFNKINSSIIKNEWELIVKYYQKNATMKNKKRIKMDQDLKILFDILQRNNKINEKFLNGIHVHTPYEFNEYTEFYINPNSTEVNEIFKINAGMRGIITIKGDLVIWRDDLLHNDALRSLQQDDQTKNWIKSNLDFDFSGQKIWCNNKFIPVEMRRKNEFVLADSITVDDLIKYHFNFKLMYQEFRKKNLNIICDEITMRELKQKKLI
jgi:hypothetical protein